MRKLSLCFAFMFMVLCALPNLADASKRGLILKNQSPFTLDAAVCYQDTNSNWKIIGWYSIKARGTRTLHLNVRNSNIYIFARNKQHNLYFRGSKSRSSDRSFYVSDSKMNYINKRQKPGGKNLKLELFRHVNLKNYQTFTYTFTY